VEIFVFRMYIVPLITLLCICLVLFCKIAVAFEY